MSVAELAPIRRNHDGVPSRQLAPGDNNAATELLSSPWPANGGYWDEDGVLYRPCYRCGIGMEMHLVKKSIGNDTYDKSEHREFCRDCNHPDLIGVFRLPDYSYIFEGAA